MNTFHPPLNMAKSNFPRSWFSDHISCIIEHDKGMFGLSKERPILGDHPKAHIHEIRRISCEIKRHSLPPALHKTEEFLLSCLIYKVFRWISLNPPDFERPIARNGNAYVFYFSWIIKHSMTSLVTWQFVILYECPNAIYCKITITFMLYGPHWINGVPGNLESE